MPHGSPRLIAEAHSRSPGQRNAYELRKKESEAWHCIAHQVTEFLRQYYGISKSLVQAKAQYIWLINRAFLATNMQGKNYLQLLIAIVQPNQATPGAASDSRWSPKLQVWLLAPLLLANLGVLGGAKAQAKSFTGACPLLPVDEVAFLRSPIGAAGKDTGKARNLSTCAVSLALNDSLQPGKPQAFPPDSGATNPLFPDLSAKPWFLAPGGSLPSTNSTALNDASSSPLGEEKKALKDREILFEHKDGKITWNSNSSGGKSPDHFEAPNLDRDTDDWHWNKDAPFGPTAKVPGPLPLLGAGAAYGWSRRLRKRIRAID